MSLQDYSLRCRNFKCFGSEPQGFDAIKPINVIIGRNNSGKTTLLDLVEYAQHPVALESRSHQGNFPEVLVSWDISDGDCSKGLNDDLRTIDGDGLRIKYSPLRWARETIIGKRITCRLNQDNQLQGSGLADFTPKEDRTVYHQQLNDTLHQIAGRKLNPFHPYEWRRIVADRDIKPEHVQESPQLAINGSGLTQLIERQIHARDRDVVEHTLLEELNKIFYPDAEYSKLLMRQPVMNGPWELDLAEPKKGKIPLSQTGSGLKTVLLVLANLILVPLAEGKRKPLSNFLFGLEELENNLHPAIQRRLFLYLRERAEKEGCHFFITTHSNVVIDLFSGDDLAQILHVKHDGESAMVTRAATSAQSGAILDDLDVRASDLLQTNAVVWVEGPSDRIYFKKWIELWSEGQLTEGIHYQCLPYGGSCNAYLTFEMDESAAEHLIAAFKINRRAIFLADSDRKKEGDKLNVHTKRLLEEVGGKGFGWVTRGRTIENYIPPTTLRQFLEKDDLDPPHQYADMLQFIADQKGNETKPVKTDLAHQITNRLTREDIAADVDLADTLDKVCALICKWNRIEVKPTRLG